MTTLTSNEPSAIRYEVGQSGSTMPSRVVAHIPRDVYVLWLPLTVGRGKLEGRGTKTFSGPIVPGMLRLAYPGETMRSLVTRPWQSMCFKIPVPLFESMYRAVRSPGARKGVASLLPILHPAREIVALSRLLKPALLLDPRNTSLLIDGVTRSLLALLLHQHTHKSDGKRNVDKLSLADMQRCTDFAEAHLGGPIQLTEWSAALDLSPGEFSRRFRVTTGVSPYRWFLDRRLERARAWILENELSLSEVAIQLGFANQSHFTDAFRRSTGFPPSKWKLLEHNRRSSDG